jgi:3-oxoacyl-[acyl-carrier protein] reductase
MVTARFGRIVVLSSTSAQGIRGQLNYATAKAGLQGFAKALAVELGGFGVTANAVAPGFIETDMTKDLPDAVRSKMLADTALGRLGSASDIAAAVAFLASPAAAYITGETLHVNGGLYMA